MAYADVYQVYSSGFDSPLPNAIFSVLFSSFFLSFFKFHPLFHTVGSFPSLRARSPFGGVVPRKSRESSTRVRGEGKEKGASAPRGCAARSRVLSWLPSLAIKPGFHMIAAIAEKKVQ